MGCGQTKEAEPQQSGAAEEQRHGQREPPPESGQDSSNGSQKTAAGEQPNPKEGPVKQQGVTATAESQPSTSETQEKEKEKPRSDIEIPDRGFSGDSVEDKEKELNEKRPSLKHRTSTTSRNNNVSSGGNEVAHPVGDLKDEDANSVKSPEKVNVEIYSVLAHHHPAVPPAVEGGESSQKKENDVDEFRDGSHLHSLSGKEMSSLLSPQLKSGSEEKQREKQGGAHKHKRVSMMSMESGTEDSDLSPELGQAPSHLKSNSTNTQHLATFSLSSRPDAQLDQPFMSSLSNKKSQGPRAIIFEPVNPRLDELKGDESGGDNLESSGSASYSKEQIMTKKSTMTSQAIASTESMRKYSMCKRQSSFGGSQNQGPRVRKSVIFNVESTSEQTGHEMSVASGGADFTKEDLLGGIVSKTYLASRPSSIGSEYYLWKEIPFAVESDQDSKVFPKWAHELQKVKALGHKNMQIIHSVFCDYGVVTVLGDFYIKGNIEDSAPDPLNIQTLARCIFRALRYAHDHGVVHGHLTKQNVFMKDVGSEYIVGDFGFTDYFSQFTPSELYGLGYQAPGMFPPERLANTCSESQLQETYTNAADIWAAGVILYEYVTCKPLFTAETEEELFASISSFSPTEEALRDVPDSHLVKVLLTALHPDPTKRLTASEYAAMCKRDNVIPIVKISSTVGLTQNSSEGAMSLMPSSINLTSFATNSSRSSCDFVGSQRYSQTSSTSPSQEDERSCCNPLCDSCGRMIHALMFQCITCTTIEFHVCRVCYYQNAFAHDRTHELISIVLDSFEEVAEDNPHRRCTVAIPMTSLNEHETAVLAMSGALPDTLDIHRRRSMAHSTCLPSGSVHRGGLMTESAATQEETPDSVIDEFISVSTSVDMMLSNFELNEVPSRLLRPCPLVNIVILDLANNELTEIPEEIELLVNIRRLILANNQLAALPDTIGNLSDLEVLDLNHNRLKDLPQALMFCDCLVDLILDYNDFEEVPPVVFDVQLLAKLYLAANPKLKSWPELELMQGLPLCTIGLDNEPLLFTTAGAVSDGAPQVAIMWNKIYPDPIIPNLYCGSLRSAQSLMVYDRLRVGYLLTVGRGLEPTVPEGMKHKTVIVDDIEGATIDNSFEEAVEFIEEAQNAGSGCLVHCFAGMSRSATTVIAYLMLRKGMRLDEAYCTTRKGRPAIYPNKGFFKQLIALDEKMYPNQRPLNMASMEREKVPV